MLEINETHPIANKLKELYENQISQLDERYQLCCGLIDNISKLSDHDLMMVCLL